MTTSKPARFDVVNADRSSVAVIAKPFAGPIDVNTSRAVEIESCRKPAVAVSISTRMGVAEAAGCVGAVGVCAHAAANATQTQTLTTAEANDTDLFFTHFTPACAGRTPLTGRPPARQDDHRPLERERRGRRRRRASESRTGYQGEPTGRFLTDNLAALRRSQTEQRVDSPPE